MCRYYINIIQNYNKKMNITTEITMNTKVLGSGFWGPRLNTLRPDEIKTKKISLGKLLIFDKFNGASRV
jgi:hypothetical protein